METARWGDSDSDDDSYVEVPDETIINEGGFYTFSTPINAGGVILSTNLDVVHNRDYLYHYFIDNWGEEEGSFFWSFYYPDLTNMADTEEMDMAANELMLMITISGRVVSSEDYIGGGTIEELVVEHLNQMSEIMSDQLASAVQELSLDDPILTGSTTYFTPPNPKQFSNVSLHTLRKSVEPPLAPVCPSELPVFLIFEPESHTIQTIGGITKLDCEKRVSWSESLGYILDEQYLKTIESIPLDSDTWTSRSNTRPQTGGNVFLLWDDGHKINIGIHGFKMTNQQSFKLDFKTADLALAELFSAPGGEGLTCPTPSHTLHQMVSAVISDALAHSNRVTVEEGNADVSVNYFNIDITTSAGIWSKKIKPGKGDVHEPLAAVSKYDISAVMMQHPDVNVSRAFAVATTNCLACEYPGYWRQHIDDVDQDLKLQSEIYEKLASMPQNTMRTLRKMCYDAVLEESCMELMNLDLNDQGEDFRKKKQRLMNQIRKLKPRSGVAIPPVPLGEIIALPADFGGISIGGNDFACSDRIIQGKGQGLRTDIQENDTFLKEYPVTNIVEHNIASEIAKSLDESLLRVSGMSHKGPNQNSEDRVRTIGDASNNIYSSSSFAQFAEIRADVARSIDALPVPPSGTWQQVYVYNGKVSIWYRIRDYITSSEGYRIDWFAVSSFEVLGSKLIRAKNNQYLFLWPRQRMRSQEMDAIKNGPRRLKAVLFSMIEKMSSTGAEYNEIVLAWQRLAITQCTSTWISGNNFITCRFLSGGLSAPSSPFDTMAKKLKSPETFADVCYLERLYKVLDQWTTRDQYHKRCALLGLPRSYAQLESYWMLWVPNEFADTNKHMVECVIALHSEYLFLKNTERIRVRDLQAQLQLLNNSQITSRELRASVRASCQLDTDGKLGWSWIGSLASAYALTLRHDPAIFDRSFARGFKHKHLTEHFTVRHSARIDRNKRIKKGTVAELMLDSGIDTYLSKLEQTHRFLFINRPCFFNHPKSGELKDREISIADPDSRLCLNDGELICGMYGKGTNVDFLKVSNKDSIFYRKSANIMQKGGAIQSSDATRYGAMMSNFAIAIMLLGLGCDSTHLKWASVIYARLAYRIMLIGHEILPYLQKIEVYDSSQQVSRQIQAWIKKMPIYCYNDTIPVGGYTTSTHMGQGMAHHSSSLLHAGGLCASQDSVCLCKIVVNGKEIQFTQNTMVTSDDSTLIPDANSKDPDRFLTRSERQRACQIFLFLQRHTRNVALRLVSVLANLPKEFIAGNKGEFNSQDTGIGYSCPILGFRELIANIVAPSAPSLIGDYLNAHAIAKTVAFSGQGMDTGNYMHQMLIDGIEARWSLTKEEKEMLRNSEVVPEQMVRGALSHELASSPASWLTVRTRGFLYSISVEHNSRKEDLDPHVKDTIFGPLMHVKIGMKSQHKSALSRINAEIKHFQEIRRPHQATMLESSKRSTLSSAKARNLGRVGTKIRNKEIKPPDFLDFTFNKFAMIENTLTWIQKLSQDALTSDVSQVDMMKGNSLSGFIKLSHITDYNFPRPPTRRRHAHPRCKKPVYRDQEYGKTPFGKHALTRSGTCLVEKIGAVERIAMQEYLAQMRHRQFTEHVEYGESFVISWMERKACKIVALDICGDVKAQESEAIKYGDFSERGILNLQNIASRYPNVPVLALHWYSAGRGLWHCIHNAIAYTILLHVDFQLHDSDCMFTQDSSGRDVLLAFQGFSNSYDWHAAGPSAGEINDYQHANVNDPMPKVIEDLELINMTKPKIKVPTYSTIIEDHRGSVLVYVNPAVHESPYNNRALQHAIVPLRGQVVAELAIGGYWHNSMKGVAFRSFLKNHFYGETIWTGAVLGWRFSSTSIPQYNEPLINSRNVRAVCCIGGIDDPEMLSFYNPDFMSGGLKVISGDKTMTVDHMTQVEVHMIPYIMACNDGRRHLNHILPSRFLNFQHVTNNRWSPANMPKEEAQEEILSYLYGDALADGW